MPLLLRLRDLGVRWAGAAALWLFAWLTLSAMLYLVLANETGMAPNIWEVVRGQAMRVLLWVPLAFFAQRAWRNFPLRGPHPLRHGAIHVGVGVACLLANYLVRVVIFSPEVLPTLFDQPLLGLSGTNFLDGVIYLGVGAFTAVQDGRAREIAMLRQQVELQSSVAAAELRALKYQLQPHFLFNALNAVVALIKNEKYDDATETLAALGTVLRNLTDGPSNEFTRLEDELMFVEKLLSIERVRFGPKLQFEINLSPALRDARVPSFVLQPLIENAVKHGIGKLMRPGKITIRTHESDEGRRLLLEVTNDVPGPSAESAPATLIPGVGLSSTRSRLRHLYGDAAALRCDLFSGSSATVALELPLTHSPDKAFPA